MKIIQVIPSFALGGAETMCENLIYSLKEKGQDVIAVSLYTLKTPITERLENSGVQVIYLDKKSGLDLSVIKKLKKVFKAEKPDVVHAHVDTAKYAVPAAVKSGVSACVYTVHNMAEKDSAGISKAVNEHYFKHKKCVPVALSSEIQKTVADYYGLKTEDIPVVFNGIDVEKCLPIDNYGFGDKIILTHIGRFSKQKNHIGLIDTFKRIHEVYPDAFLRLVGDGELRGEIEKYVAENGLTESVEFMGKKDSVFSTLHETDIFVLPSLYEGFPMTIIEAMASGVPVVATAVGGVTDMIDNGVNGYAVPCDVESICKACFDLIENEEKRESFGKNAIKKSVEFSAKEMAEKYNAVYLKAVAENKR